MRSPEPEVKRLYRSRKDRMIAGVCGGIANYFHMDPTAVRLIFIVLSLLGLGAFIIIYLICWIVIPNAPWDSTDNGR
jgi:phage shock protein C